MTDHAFEVARERPLDGVVREALTVSWNAARAMIRSGKVTVDETIVSNPLTVVRAGARVSVRPNAPRRDEHRLGAARVVHIDPHLVVVDKPSGISTVPYEPGERGTLEELTRQELVRRHGHPRTASLGVVHRIDKETSGLVVFARTFAAKKRLSFAFREHTIERRYLALVHGHLSSARTFDSVLVEDRGDGLRGSTRRAASAGQRAITHVEPLARGPLASFLGCQLETGRTHQIRIHLSEAGHPLVGERVYIRDWLRHGGKAIPAPRLMLHAWVLGFVHPITGAPLRFEQPPPEDFDQTRARLIDAG